MSFMQIESELRFFEFVEGFLVFGEVYVIFEYCGKTFEFLDKGVKDLFCVL
jgi:hypothetical protein